MLVTSVPSGPLPWLMPLPHFLIPIMQYDFSSLLLNVTSLIRRPIPRPAPEAGATDAAAYKASRPQAQEASEVALQLGSSLCNPSCDLPGFSLCSFETRTACSHVAPSDPLPLRLPAARPAADAGQRKWQGQRARAPDVPGRPSGCSQGMRIVPCICAKLPQPAPGQLPCVECCKPSFRRPSSCTHNRTCLNAADFFTVCTSACLPPNAAGHGHGEPAVDAR